MTIFRFTKNQRVKIVSENEELAEVNRKEGEIVGWSDPYKDGTRDYGVFVFETEVVWQVNEKCIRVV